MKNLLLIVDPQNDFILPGSPLCVDGADRDMKRLVAFMLEHRQEITEVMVTTDQHIPNQIFFSSWWADRNGTKPPVFTVITSADIESGKWIPQYKPDWSRAYVKELENSGQAPLVIWPAHCLAGSKGAEIHKLLSDALGRLIVSHKYTPVIVRKGMVPHTEHYGAFEACVPDDDEPQSLLNTAMLSNLTKYDSIIIGGEAEDFCVRETIRQILRYFKVNGIIKTKVVVLTDCMSMVFKDEKSLARAKEVRQEFVQSGAQLVTSRELFPE